MVQQIGSQIASKLSVQTYGWTKEKLVETVLANKEESIHLMRVLGSANGLKPYAGRQQPDGTMSEAGHSFLGNFRTIGSNAAPVSPGETVNGAQLFLPKYIENMMSAALTGEDISAVEFAFDIYADYNPKAATMYSFSVRDLTGKSQSALDEMEASLALPMPSTTVTPQVEDKSKKA